VTTERAPEAGTEASQRDARILGDLGALLLDAGTSVTDVREHLEHAPEQARAGLDFSVLPRMVLVVRVDDGAATLVSASGKDLSFRQGVRASRLAREVELGTVPVAEVPARVDAIRSMTRPHAARDRILGSAAVALGLAVVFRCPWWAVLTSVLVGALVGALVLALDRLEGAGAVVPFLSALLSTVVVGATASALDLGDVPLYAVCAPIAVLVPGALVTNALLELTATDIVTGAARLVYGVLVLGLMSAGIAAGSHLTGLTLDHDSATLVGTARKVTASAGGWHALPPIPLSWLGVVVLALGIGLAFGAGLRLTLVTVAVMVATYALLALLTPVVGAITASGAAAAIVFVGARAVERRALAVPATATFQPAFLLLVPGTVGLVALASTDVHAFTTSLATFVSLCLGTKIGAVLADTLPRLRLPSPRTSPTQTGARP